MPGEASHFCYLSSSFFILQQELEQTPHLASTVMCLSTMPYNINPLHFTC